MNIINMKKIKSNRAFTTADVAISIVIITIFVGIIATLFYNFYTTIASKNRNAIATNCLIDVIEEAKIMNYDEVNQESIDTLIQTLISNQTIPQGYTVTADVQNYNEIEGNEDKSDLIKILKVIVEYTLNDKTEKIEISTILTK